MERLWSPWRLRLRDGQPPATTDVHLLRAAGGSPREARASCAAVSYVILNLYPYNSGHLMVVPNRHVGSLAAATPEELTELMRFMRDAEIALTEAYQPQGINVGINLGRPAGAGVLDHCTSISCRGGPATRTSCRSSANVRVLPEELATRRSACGRSSTGWLAKASSQVPAAPRRLSAGIGPLRSQSPRRCRVAVCAPRALDVYRGEQPPFQAFRMHP